MKSPHSSTTFLTIILGTALACTLAGCNLPRRDQAPSTTPNVTQAYETVQARLTQNSAATPPAMGTPSPTNPTITPSTLPSTPLASPTLGPTIPISTATPRVACDQAAAGSPIDVTIPDDTILQAGQSFTKVWRLQNIGSCTWNKSYAVAFFSGDQMSASPSVSLAGDVSPGQSVDIAVDLVAPTKAGNYQGNWKLRNASNVLFGIGPGSAAPFWVRIQVALTPTPTSTPRTATLTPTSTQPATFTSTPTPTSPAHIVGTASLNVGATLDMDTDQINGGVPDLAYAANDAGKHQFNAQGSALLGIFGSSQPGQANCQASALGTSPIIVEDISVGTYLCYRTGEGRYGRARLSNFNTDNFTVTLEFLTWP